ncbi:hypothetical protein K60_023160 [Mycobacterium tuberculosis variant bovis BCG str. Korea 1168P]|uniref:Type II toxin-antitoxin system VapC family toxin n=1 Tax=Mycobacterium tuberculosis (strain ATCC 25177 / H37Ra) TaxID=419947 RepID=A5U4R3_MYCTA|nr:hypothetical protein MRA_2251 [Mycobacterium tuberculosis H37Ra]AGE68226.1 hypothetical protein K60_023160 [Mycobacterium tuberculosis variant bovis BCG str. Korea 1168P]EFD77930.1 conserved hypothetical protein [Mycobacterium tuberculosis T85]
MKRYLIDTHVWLRMPSTKHGRLFRTSATAFSCRPPVPGRSRSTTASASSRRPSHRPLTCPIECAAAARRRCQLTTHTLRTAELPDHHRHPFDRVLIAQAQLLGLTIITADALLAACDVAVVAA